MGSRFDEDAIVRAWSHAAEWLATSMANAMANLRTNHDAGPAARAEPSDWGTRREGRGTGNTPDQIAWAVVLGDTGFVVDDFFVSLEKAKEAFEWRRKNTSYGARIIPLYARPQPALTDDEVTALKAVTCGNDVLKWNEIEDTLRGLLERAK